MLLKKLDDQRIADQLHRLELSRRGKESLFVVGLNFLQKESRTKGGFYPSSIGEQKSERISKAFISTIKKHGIGNTEIGDRVLRNVDICDLLKYYITELHAADDAIMQISFNFDSGIGSQPAGVTDKDITESNDFDGGGGPF